MANTLTSLDQTAVSTLRFLSVDMVEEANSGHPGLPLGAAPMAYALFKRVMKFHPQQSDWFNRDRFILSAGHGSALLYSLLHVFGFDLPVEELRRFRQMGSRCPGHPEVGMTLGVECTTGPLGQGFANGVGMAMAEQWLAARYNVGGATVVDHYTYAIVSDGDLMEGVAQEAASLAGHLGLGKLIYLYDSNDISLDGPCDHAFTENVVGKFEAMGWHVQVVKDGNDLDAIESAIRTAQAEHHKPSLIEVKTVIGYGSPVSGTSKAHGAPLGGENVKETKKRLDWPTEPTFYRPDEIDDVAAQAVAAGEQAVAAWREETDKLKAADPALYSEFQTLMEEMLPEGWDTVLDTLEFPEKLATRDAGQTALNALSESIPWLIGGGADLASSTKTVIKDSGIFDQNSQTGRNIWFGVREHAMGAIVNGMALHGLRPFGSTFLVFSDYMRGSIRLSCLSNLNTFFVFTHDSVFVGEDGPTHQPIEHVSSLRLVPGHFVYRPADAYETVACWAEALRRSSACSIIETRQAVPTLSTTWSKVKEGVATGAYVVADTEETPDVVLVATGSEVSLALASRDALQESGISARVVSMPCREAFLAQDKEVRQSVLPTGVPRVSIEAGVTSGWREIVGDTGACMGIDRFGESAPGDEVYAHLGMTVDHVVETVRSVLV